MKAAPLLRFFRAHHSKTPCPPSSLAKADRKSTRLNSSHGYISYAVFCLKKKTSTSMNFDTMAGRPLEIEALTCAVVTAGQRHGIATPLNRTLLALARTGSYANIAAAAST